MRISKKYPLAILLAGLATALILASCSSTIVNRDPVGDRFPTVKGTALSGDDYTLPEDLAGKPAILLVGYVQRTQFDLDRWLYGLLKSGVTVPIYEVPTIEGLAPRLASGWIDSGMRRGIPEEDWPAVITVYGGAENVVAMTGNETPQNGRVLLLDGDGQVVFFHDRGFSAGALIQLEEAASKLQARSDSP